MWFLFPIYGKANAGLSLGVCFLDFLLIGSFALRGEGGLRRPLSFNSERKGKRTPAKTTFLHFLSALYSSKRRSCIPRVRMRFSYSIHHRIVYAPAPLPLTDAGKCLCVYRAGRCGHRPLLNFTAPFRRGRRPRRPVVQHTSFYRCTA